MKMIKKRNIYVLVFLFSILLQGLSILQYIWKNEEIYTFNWLPQFILIVIFSIITTIVQYFIKNNKVRYYIFIIRFVLILIIHFPVGIYIGLKQMFLFSFLLDLSFFISFPVNSLFSIFSFFSIYLISIISQVRAKNIPLPELHNFVYISIYSLLVIFIFTLFKYFYDSYSVHENQITRLNQTINKLTDANSGFQHYIRIVEEKSTEDERNRIIREIHDSIGYTLTTIMMLSTSIMESEKVNLSSNHQQVLNNIKTYAKSGLNDMRIVLRLLKVKKKKVESDLIQLNRMVKAFEKATDVKIRLEFGNAPNKFKEEVSHLIFRLVQEGMINSLRHGLATNVDIFLFIESQKLIITISDNGRGFSEMTPGIGLKGMKERLNKIDGDISISNSKIGVTLRIKIPMDKV